MQTACLNFWIRIDLMIKRLIICLLFVLPAVHAQSQIRTVWMETTYGPMLLSLDEEAAPTTVANFLDYVNEGFYDGLIFQRVIPGFVVQTGTFESDLGIREPTRAAIASERNNGLLNTPGTLAMALSGNPPDVDSARAAWYINTGINDFLDSDFTVFGRVSAGQATLDAMNIAPTVTARTPNFNLPDFPVEPPRIIRMFETDGYPLAPLHTGSWFDPQNPGRGLNVEVADGSDAGSDATLVIYLYDFVAGSQFWLAGNVNFDFGPSEVTVPMLILDGPEFGDAFNPDDRNIESWGTITFEVTGCQTAVMKYQSPEFGTGERPLVRLTRPNDLKTCEGL
jgi:peptidyl-prolyl cis-trans isomerase A (cyclophilin A)